MKQNSQVNDVIKHLKMYGSITSIEAFEYYGITRLSGIIYRLRNEQDLDIITENKIFFKVIIAQKSFILIRAP